MNYIKYLVLAFVLVLPINVYSGFDNGVANQTDTLRNQFSISAYYDLRDRKTYIQVTNPTSDTINIHVQVFQQDRSCDELDFNDVLTANDTVIYDLDNIIRNNGTAAPISLLDDSYGYVVITRDDGNGVASSSGGSQILGNFRIVDDAGYEYRTNMSGGGLTSNAAYANFNTIDGANYADVVGYVMLFNSLGMMNFDSTIQNWDPGIEWDIFVYDMDEEPLSCDRRNFACGATMVYGVNEDYPASKGDPLLCPGGGLADPQGGFVNFVNPNLVGTGVPELPSFLRFIGFIGINNGNGTGSMDGWYGFQDVSF